MTTASRVATSLCQHRYDGLFACLLAFFFGAKTLPHLVCCRQDIHLNQIGFDKAWRHIIQTYLRPITAHWYTGYNLEGRVTLDFVVRYRPDRQSFLRPHHDASTVTLNVALNQGTQARPQSSIQSPWVSSLASLSLFSVLVSLQSS